MVMFCGFTLGGALGGLSAAVLIADFGWQGVLVLGGVLPLVLAAALLFLLATIPMARLADWVNRRDRARRLQVAA